ncbi:AraC family transcriptional activator of pobA [Pontibacter mucosus]|uniref:AraC family transcriptional activator of pobA n=1 Tax=Pontibacter mucosus TaxID=1649266 RepID=A0A2T5YG52_9BACT|nr:AraC family transcriptional regulator [Pontibacter mucosus]PTX18292.1 AraC family transcriptional activator of pobA [Pontibacter mucosus]
MPDKRFYKGLYGTNSIEFAKGLINVHPFGEIGRQYDGQVKLHAHNNLFQIFLMEQGTTVLYHAAAQTTIEGPALITVPKNYEHGFLHQGEVSGWIISLSDTVLEHMLQREAEVVYTLDNIYLFALSPDFPDAMAVSHTIQKCVQEYNRQYPGRLLMLHYLVGQLLVQLYRLSIGSGKQEMGADNVSKIYFRRFQQLIKEEHSYKKGVEAYACQLHISTGHLSRVCRSIAGKSPKDILIDYFITEAQLALADVEKSVSEVCFALGFDDPAYFTRLFKKRTGLTPMAFRKQIGVKRA